MAIPNTYHDMLTRSIEAIAGKGRPIVIFGASKAGWYVMKVLEANGIKVTAFCDNDPQKAGHTYHGHPTFLPADLYENFPDALVFIGVFRREVFQKIKHQLTGLGFSVQDADAYVFLYSYFMDIAKRECDRGVFAETVRKLSAYYSRESYAYGYVDDGLFVSPFVTGVVTQKCNLRCFDCGQRIPYYELPQDFAVDALVKDIQQYCSAFDLVPEISLHGGEPFLHPELGRICREVSKIPNLVFINLITNGKLIPSEDTLRDLSSSGADLHQSDYGKLSRHQKEVFSACSEHHIFCDIHFVDPSEKWTRSPPIRQINRSVQENDEVYKQCVSSRICCQIMDGKLYRCPLSAHASAQGLIPLMEDDAVELKNAAISNDERIQNIRAFLTRTTAMNVCKYCDPEGGTLVEPAIQLSKRNRMILENGGQI
ncbi:MAG: hypothetical protein K8H84_09690 [Sulfuricella denitrificans]|nr:hypothetical protein [Sulfuricella denitrificans]